MFLASNLQGNSIHEKGRLSVHLKLAGRQISTKPWPFWFFMSPGRLVLGRAGKEVGLGFLQQSLAFLTPYPPDLEAELFHTHVLVKSCTAHPHPPGNLYFFSETPWNCPESPGLSVPQCAQGSNDGSMVNFVTI